MSLPVIEAIGVSKHFKVPSRKLGQKAKDLVALDNVSLSVGEAEIFGIVGESGCGKTTLGRVISKLEEASSGKVFFRGSDITKLSGSSLLKLRSQLQIIFQNPYGSFNPKQRIGPAFNEVAHVHHIPKDEAPEKISSLLNEVGMPHDVLSRFPSELSGGQLQRLAIARALILNPSFIVADEPVSALDVSVQAQILNLVMDLRDKHNMAMLFISHEMPVVKAICSSVAVMYLGGIVETAQANELFSNALHPYTKALMSAVPNIELGKAKERVILEGDIPSAIDLGPGCPFEPRCRYSENKCKHEKPTLKSYGQSHLAACHLLG